MLQKKYLILGTGEVGMCLAQELLRSETNSTVHIHTLTEKSMQNKLLQLTSNIHLQNRIGGSYGDIYLTKKYLNTQIDLSNIDIKDIDYLYSDRENWYEDSLIYELIKTIKPNYIIDTVTLAVKFVHNFIYDLYNNKVDQILINKILFCNPITTLNTFVQSMRHAIRDFDVLGYIKVSSSGLGGMGFNCPYTHGSTNRFKLSPSMELKIASLGIMHQLLWNLSDSELAKISLVIPKALIGWDKPFKLSTDKDVFFQFKKNEDQKTIIKDKLLNFSISCIPCGDSTHYSIQEYIVASSVGQFESISKEEVVAAIIDNIHGGDKYNVLSSINSSAISSSYQAFSKREEVISEARKIENNSKTPSLVTGNFGPYISKLIAEVYIIVCALSSNKKVLDYFSLINCSELCHNYLETYPMLRDQILAANLAIETKIGSWFLCENYSYYETVDLKDENILLWTEFLKTEMLEKKTKSFALNNVGKIVSKYLVKNGFSRVK